MSNLRALRKCSRVYRAWPNVIQSYETAEENSRLIDIGMEVLRTFPQVIIFGSGKTRLINIVNYTYA